MALLLTLRRLPASIHVIVRKMMLGFQLLILDLIFPNGTLVARPVEVDDSAGVIDDRVIGIKSSVSSSRETSRDSNYL